MSYNLTGLVGNLSNYAVQTLLKHLVNKVVYTPVNLYLGLFTDAVTPTDAADGTEPVGLGYARVQIAGTGWTTPTGTNRITNNVNEVSFTASGGNWGNIKYVGLFDALSGGNYIGWGELGAVRTIEDGDTLAIAVNELGLGMSATPP